MDPFIAQIMPWPANFAPRNWAFCNGQLLSIAQNTALFSLIGDYYGGDGRTTFALPDLRGRTIVGAGAGPGLANRQLGEWLGQETITLVEANVAEGTGTQRALIGSQGANIHDNMQPTLVLNYIIALNGIYPARS